MSLLQVATEVRENAWVPYSRFKVGAAVRGASGTIYRGCNVENAAYPEGTCAEAGAIAAMVAAGETRLTEVLVIADCPAPVPPCGGCRQKLAEFGAPDVAVTLCTTDGLSVTTSIGALLPGAFTPAHMDRT
jgi:cytidine deaminase